MSTLPAPGFAPATVTALPSLNTAKTLGGLGCVFILLVFLPAVGGLMGLVGLIFIGVALKQIADRVGDRRIFENYLFALVTAIAGVVIGVVVVIASVLRAIGLDALSNTDWAGWTPSPGEAVGLAVAVLLGLAVMWAALLLSAIFVRRAGDAVADRLNVRLFRTGGLVYLVGAALTVVLVGFLLMAVALLIFAVAFFSIPDMPTSTPPPGAAPSAGGGS